MTFLNRFTREPLQEDTLTSVVRNLRNLLNTKKEYGSRLRDFGLGDYFGQQGVQAAAMSVMHEILYDIGKYEPRLRANFIRTVDDAQLPLSLELHGDIQSETGPPLSPTIRFLPCRLGVQWDAIHGVVTVEVLDVITEKELRIMHAEQAMTAVGEPKLLTAGTALKGAKNVR